MSCFSMKVPRKILSICLVPMLSGLCLLGPGPATAQEGKSRLGEARAAMRAKDYTAAVDALDEILSGGEDLADEAAYLLGLSFFYQGKYGDATLAADSVIEGFPESDWRRKAIFLRARSLVELKRFEEAEGVYEKEANRLLSAKRKDEIAGIIVDFADDLTVRPGPDDLDAPPPNHDKASTLYQKVLAMEIGRDLRDSVTFKAAHNLHRAGNTAGAFRMYVAYLEEFDPSWTGLSGSGENRGRLPRERPPAAGRHRFAARYELAETLLAEGRTEQARREIEDLLALIEKGGEFDPALPADCAWLIVKSYNLPGTAAADLDRAVEGVRDFLTAHPKDPRAAEAAFRIAETYRNLGRSEEAVAAYLDFIEGRGFEPPGDAPDGDEGEMKQRARAEQLEQWRMASLFSVGQIRFDQRKYHEAVDVWSRYTARFPNGPQWSLSQQRIVNARFQLGIQALSGGEQQKARRLFEDFLQSYPLDGRSRQILFLFGQMHYESALELEESEGAAGEVNAALLRAVKEWSRLASKYPNTEESNLALYRTAMIYEEKLDDLEKALATYRRVTGGSWYSQAHQRLAVMTRKELTLTTERTFRTGEQAVVTMNVRNIPTVTFRQYTLDLEAYFRKTHGTGGVENLDIDLIEPDRTWEVEVESYGKYRPIEQRVDVAFEGKEPGVCVINASEDDWSATTLVIRSDIDIITRSSRREVLVFAVDRLRNEPAPATELLLSDGASVFATVSTGEDGVFHGSFPEVRDLARLRVFARREGHVSSDGLDLTGLGLSTGLSPRGFIYTDRSTYRPGREVSVRGILRDVSDGSYVVPADAAFLVAVTDVRGRLLREEPVELSEFGTFHSTFTLPAGAPHGLYTVTARQERGGGGPLVFSGTFQVREFKLQKIRLALEFERSVYFRGETVTGEVRAEYYWGEPLAGRAVRTVLPDGRTFLVETDDEGKVPIVFDTTAMIPGQPLSFAASLEGEDVGVRKAVTLARLGFSVSLFPSQDLVLAGEPFDVTVTATGADGEPAGRELTVTVLHRPERPENRVIAAVPWISEPHRPPAEVTVEEFTLTTDPATGKAFRSVTLEKGGRYLLRVSGRDRFDQTTTAAAGMTVSGEEDAVKLRFFADSSILQVGREARVRLHSRLDPTLALTTQEGEEIIRYRVIRIDRGYNDLELPIGHEHFPNFSVAVAAMDGRALRTASKEFTVERQLRLTLRPLEESLLPGGEGKFELIATDQLDRPVRAELSLALVEEALFARFPDETPKIRDFFQAGARRQAEFRVGSTCDFRYDGVTRAAVKEITAEKDRLIRSEEEEARLKEVRTTLAGAFADEVQLSGKGFSGERPQVAKSEVARKPMLALRSRRADEPAPPPSTAPAPQDMMVLTSPAAEPRREIPDEGRWLPAIVTGEDGKATVTLTMPEKTTEWRLTARGCTVETLVGEARSSTITKKDFFVEIKAPAVVQEGDEIRVVARVHNLADYAGPARVRLLVTGKSEKARVLAEQEKTVEVTRGGGEEVVFSPVEVPGVLELDIQVAAEAGDLSDTMVLPVPVRPWGLEYAAHAGGVFEADTALLLELHSKLRYTSRWMTVSVSPSLNRAVVDLALGRPVPVEYAQQGAGAVVPPPPLSWGAFDGSELLAAVSGIVYARQVKAPDAVVGPLVERARRLVTGLVMSQAGNGSWTVGGNRQVDDWAATSRAFWALVRARETGIAVNAGTVDRARKFLDDRFRQFAAGANEAKAVVLHALSVNDAADFANVNRLYRERNELGTAALAHTCLAFLNLGRPEIAGELIDLLEKRVSPMNRGGLRLVSWEPKAKHPWLNDVTETTALVLLALSRGRPGSPLAGPAANFLMDRKGCFGISPVKARGPVVAALASWFGLGSHADTDERITIRVNGTPVATVEALGGQPTRAFTVPPSLIKEGRNLVEFVMQGRGKYACAATLRGFSSSLLDPKSWGYPYPHIRRYTHAPLEYRGRPINASSSTPVENLESGQRTFVFLDNTPRSGGTSFKGYMVLEEFLPAGTTLVEGTLSGNFQHYEVGPAKITMYYPPNTYAGDVSYQLVGYSPGRYRVLPAVMRDAVNPGRMRLGPRSEMTVLAAGEESPDPYRLNRAELFALGKLTFDDGLYGEALEYLAALFTQDRDYHERDLARMLLWIYTAEGYYDAARIVELFEILHERYPALEIPYDKILLVGRAYGDIGEHERAWLVFRATIAASFITDSHVSAVLQDEGRFLGSIDFQESLWREYPDTADVVSTYFALPQALARKAPEAHTMPKEGDLAPDRIDMLTRSVDLLSSFLTLYPENPLADDTAFSLANTLLDLKDYALVVKLSRLFVERYGDSPLASSFQYMAALGLFWQSEHEAALKAAAVVADGESKDRDFARYILGQIYHAQGKPSDAIEWYGTVRSVYPDASEAISYFEEKRIALEEVTIVRPGRPGEITITSRNIDEAFLQVYRVDLMKLYLREKNLSTITRVRLAGIDPETQLTVPIAGQPSYREEKTTVRLPLEKEGAYLVICRGGDLFTSGLMLLTPLAIEVQEDKVSGRVRANVLDAVEGGYRAEVHVKAIGSADETFLQGDTDRRGIFVADGLRGKVTVIAREDASRYAFYRGDDWVGAPEAATPRPVRPEDARRKGKMDFQQNLRMNQEAIQNMNFQKFDQMRRMEQRGVEIQATF